jgi:rsbT co-antagonist protein RsbR
MDTQSNQQELEQLRSEVATLHQRVAELEQQVDDLTTYRLFFEHLPIVTVIYGPDGLAWGGNPENEKVMGVPTEALTGKFNILNDPEAQRQGYAAHFRQALQGEIARMPPTSYDTGQTVGLEGRIDSRLVWLETFFFPMYDAQGAVRNVVEVCLDVGQRMQTEKDLHIAQFALDRAGESIFLMDEHAQLSYVNDATCRNLGYSREELLSMSVPDLDPNFSMDAYRAGWKIWSQETDHATIFETRHRHKDGTTIPVEVSDNYIEFDGKGYLFAFVRDITERKRAENELRLFKALVENSPDAIGIADMNGVLQYANHAYKELTGYGDEVVGKSFNDHYAAEDISNLDEKVQAFTAAGSWKGMLTWRHKDNTKIQVQGSVFSVQDSEGENQGIAGIFRDMTEHLRAEQERTVLQEQIIESQRIAISELSTPLLPLADNVVALPLVGTIDSSRAQQVMETLLEGIALHQADLAIVDITGVRIVDTQVAQALIRTAQAVRLLGAQIILTGIQPQIAQTLIHLGVDMGEIVTRSTLQGGIAFAMNEVSRV